MINFDQLLHKDYGWEKLHTKQLLNLRDELRLVVIDIDERSAGHEYVYDQYDQLRKKILEVLSTREHVPNKIEAKKIRQEKAKAAKNR